MSDVISPLIEVAELESRLSNADVVVVDCRFNLMNPAAGRAAWKAGHIPGAVYAHLDDDLARPAQPDEGRHPLPAGHEFAATLGRLGITPNSTVVAYDDQGGAIAARLWWMLGWIGHQRRHLLNGGLNAWQAAELPLEAGDGEQTQMQYGPVDANDALIVSTEEIDDTKSALLLDARARARFRGEVEPIDPIAGHVPGALNLPFTELLDADDRFLAADELRGVFSAVITHGTSPDAVIAMCGSGVTGCHLLAGLAIAHNNNTAEYPGRLYVGSWSEWIKDPSRHIATAD